MHGEALGPHGDRNGCSLRVAGRHAKSVTVGKHYLVAASHRGLEKVGAADEVRDKARDGSLVDGLRRVDLKESALVHDPDTVAHGDRLLLVMCDVDEGDTNLALQVLQLGLHLLAEFEVEGAERFVEEEHLGSVDQRSGKGNPLLLPAGELVGFALFHPVHLDEADRPVDQVGSFVLVDLAHLEAESDVCPNIHVWEEGVTLKHGVDGTLVGRT